MICMKLQNLDSRIFHKVVREIQLRFAVCYVILYKHTYKHYKRRWKIKDTHLSHETIIQVSCVWVWVWYWYHKKSNRANRLNRIEQRRKIKLNIVFQQFRLSFRLLFSFSFSLIFTLFFRRWRRTYNSIVFTEFKWVFEAFIYFFVALSYGIVLFTILHIRCHATHQCTEMHNHCCVCR